MDTRESHVESIMPSINQLKAHLAVPIDSLVKKFLEGDKQAEADLMLRLVHSNWKSDTKSLKWAEEHPMASLASPREWTLMGLILEYGIGKPANDLQVAIMCYNKAGGDAIAQLRLGIYFVFKAEVPDLEKAKTYLEIAKTKTPEALYVLGLIVHKEKNNKHNKQRDALLYEAYKQGSLMVHADLVACEINRNGQSTKKKLEFIELYLEAIAKGHANTLINLAKFWKSDIYNAIFIARFVAELCGQHDLLAEFVGEQERRELFPAFHAAIGLRDSKKHEALFTHCKDAVKHFSRTRLEFQAKRSGDSIETINFLLDFDTDENVTDQEKDVMILVTQSLLKSVLTQDMINLILKFFYPPLVVKKIPGMLKEEDEAKTALQQLKHINIDLPRLSEDRELKEEAIKKQTLIKYAEEGIVPHLTTLRMLFFSGRNLLASGEILSEAGARPSDHKGPNSARQIQ